MVVSYSIYSRMVVGQAPPKPPAPAQCPFVGPRARSAEAAEIDVNRLVGDAGEVLEEPG